MLISGVSSNWNYVHTGVPQGTILGPLLFTIFVNDLPRVVEHCSINLYADDTTIYCSAKDPSIIRDRLGSDLACVAKWIEDNGLKINVSKTQLLVLSPPRRQEHAKTIKLCLKGEEIVQQEKVKYLGVIVDNKLNWKPHIQNLRRKCLAGLAFLRRYGTHLPVNSRKLLYQSFILSQLDYCSVVYDCCSKTLSDKVERIQNYAMRIILSKPPRTSSEPLRKQLGLTTLKIRRQNATLLQVHRCLHRCAPLYLNNKFMTNSSFGYSSTRGANKLHLNRPNSNYYRNSFEFQGALMFNILPDEIRSLVTKAAFRRALIRHSQTLY